MVSAIASQHRHVPENQLKAGKPETGEGFAPGNSADSVGHRAKAMVAETGDTDPGAQGRAASTIARMDITVLTPPPEEAPAE
ncbi:MULTISPECIES: hypothetical protein [Mesorhizobium]|uniref:Uncharacterized protein n=2 Tax=Mesorhizobium TaxID=68287 RepID=G6Y869_9HYPH|nr:MULTISPECIES: hypothetical protein [Mesorhizobium]ANT52180.1 hypothetical protein A6B35_20945 [Mesorhizobium amorphae CCNWGS0123]EHH12107.1 hypothetical protein MEA186_10679 [Mesorhizobium amorphae CCNWGS0123]RJT27761.1 hypothetical protein D3227_35605 [Mesorhizobium waimense]GLR44851.1 hypothetical protein GCM10007880_53680 [Mesorhizobium amorphae]